MIDDVVLYLDELIVGIRHDALLEIVRDERHHDSNRQQRRNDPRKGDAGCLERRDFALAREPLNRKQRAEEQSHRNYQDDVGRQRPPEDRKRSPKRGVLAADELADIENLRRCEDQRKRGQSEDERPR